MTNTKYGIDQQIAEVEREIAMRVRVYTGMIRNGKMTETQAHAQTDCMREVLNTLHNVKSITGGRSHADEST
jgi:hypothetical protein